MQIIVNDNPSELGKAAGSMAAQIIRTAVNNNGEAVIILATGTSQFETLLQLTNEDIDWSKVTMFHLDEYIALPKASPASFRRYLDERFIQKVRPLKEIHLIHGETNSVEECMRLNNIIRLTPVDLALVGIGENGHLGFNDPPANFETEEPFIIVELDEKCRQQQLGEGWFKTIGDVPRTAITMSVKQIMKSAAIICSVPESRKAIAVRDCFDNPVSNLFPAGILQLHTNCVCFLDRDSSALLNDDNI
ncbi:glucosamine-6-phosphate deaminase [Ginsengibacter hankyongi]|uniref:Glucosamine-6-phosphate deaminase n=1 Tax=Ginsengibacter hankyongi TaxID=2607284 RepID=A0A5J5IBF6_9BACT|nr:glucosamine-6-phosphate deaminase [Ginsengibacter hankyongi]KAA9035527.1 glucosamine-6-phosphate deaminase [Ginsengibacter hankyongi]